MIKHETQCLEAILEKLENIPISGKHRSKMQECVSELHMLWSGALKNSMYFVKDEF